MAKITTATTATTATNYFNTGGTVNFYNPGLDNPWTYDGCCATKDSYIDTRSKEFKVVHSLMDAISAEWDITLNGKYALLTCNAFTEIMNKIKELTNQMIALDNENKKLKEFADQKFDSEWDNIINEDIKT